MDWSAHFAGDAVIASLLTPPRLYTATEAAARSDGAPRRAGIYAWYFDTVPAAIDARQCHRSGRWTLLYCGISPKRPPANGRAPSKSHLRTRLRTHFSGNAAGSTLRLTLGCLLEDEIGTILRRVGSWGRLTFTNPGEQVLDRWLHAHARVVWAAHPAPWEPEDALLASGLPLPLDIKDNPCAVLTAPVSALRSAAKRRAEDLPLIGDSGGPRRAPTVGGGA